MSMVFLINGIFSFFLSFVLGVLINKNLIPFLPYLPLRAYVVPVLTLPLLLFTGEFIIGRFQKVKDVPSEVKADMSSPFLCVFILVFTLFVVFGVDLRIFYVDIPFFKDLYLSKFTYLLALIPLFALALYLRVLVSDNTKSIKIVNAFVLGVMVILSLNMGSFVVFNEFHRYNEFTLNFQIVLNPIVQVFLGNGMLIEAKSQYGLYAQFFEPILRLIGFNLTSITGIFAVIVAASLFMIGYVLYSVLRNKMLALIGFIAFIFVHYFSTTQWPGELYLQYWPIRTLFPAIAFFLFYRHLCSPTLLNFTFGCFILSLGVLWNIDVGVVSFLSYVITACILIYVKVDRPAAMLKAVVSNLAISLFTLLLTFIGFAVYMRIRYSAWPNFSLLFESQGAFMGEKVYLQVAQYNFWIIVVLIYSIGLAFVLRRIKDGAWDKHVMMIGFSVFLGLGIFTYHANNGFPQVLGACTYPSLFVAIIFCRSCLNSAICP